VSLPDNASEALKKLARCAELTRFLGVDGEALKLMISDNYGDLVRAAEAVMGAFRAKYSDEKEWQEKIEPYDDQIRSRKRDALTDYLMTSLGLVFKNLNDLYQYFLIDVALEGCARTSRVVAAISSVQLYVQRCMMNLEQDARDPDDPNSVAVSPESIPEDEWAWRKNYRLWEANRKVFLYPENYIEPELRDDKTPLFKDLESTLLQQEINAQNVLDAYTTYMKGFVEVAKLKIAGVYHDISESTKSDIMHLFGVTPGDPPTYYYRTVENALWSQLVIPNRGMVWSPWRKIEVQIPVRKVAPVVYNGRLYVFWVQIVTTSKNKVVNGESKFIGYQHNFVLKYTTLHLNGDWTPPQTVSWGGISIPYIHWQENGVIKDVIDSNDRPFFDTVPHPEPKEAYTLKGLRWDVYPQFLPLPHDPRNQLIIAALIPLVQNPIDFYDQTLKSQYYRYAYSVIDPVLYTKKEGSDTLKVLYSGLPISFWSTDFGPYTWRSIVLEEWGLRHNTFILEDRFTFAPIASLDLSSELKVVNGAFQDCIIDTKGDLLLLQGSVRPGLDYVLKRLGTTLSEKVNRILFTEGVDKLLDIETQQTLFEDKLSITPLNHILDFTNADKLLDFGGPYGVYYREIFFHIPFLIANYLSSQQQYAAAQRWYHYIFNPTAREHLDLERLSAEERARKQRDCNWRYREFRDLNVPTMRQILTNFAAIETYKEDPWNPHAIARLRLSAYQKCIVMKYIDNLLDWGDSLFAEFTRESVNEATQLYVLAAEILGDHPAELGECGEEAVTPRTYEKIAPLVKRGSEFLAELETYVWSYRELPAVAKEKLAYHYTLEPIRIRSTLKLAGATTPSEPFPQIPALEPLGSAQTTDGELYKGYDWKTMRTSYWSSKGDKSFQVLTHDSLVLKDHDRIPGFSWSLIRQVSPVFCVPTNEDLLRYWERVDDRLYKIRNCMDITGARRQLALFAPEINPALLVRAKALGLSLEDVLNATSGNLPPYRFNYLIERAKSYASVVQGFGAALLSALEKKDLEELNRLRTVQQQNLLKLTTRVFEGEISIAADTISSLERQQAAVQYRKDYYQRLIDNDLTGWERTQQVARHMATSSFILASILSGHGGILALLPQLGSPFAMKYGGVELTGSVTNWARMFRDTANIAESISVSAGLEAGFKRRMQGWDHQVHLADKELRQIEKQLAAAKIREVIAEKSLEIHQQSILQMEVMYDFFVEKFSNLGLYTWLSTTLQRLYREAYNSAFSMARLAEQAFYFERGEDVGPLLGAGYWEASRAGLLAGERLLMDLQSMERRFIETNYRSLEIDQAFSLTQLNPAALVQLRETGSCEFEVPEIFFDLFYPGQYRRKIKAIRLTIPAITGPYTNVSTTVILTGSKLRNEPKLGEANLREVPLRRSVSIATSTAQNDAGVFDLNFRDERYMPFEGAGAISSWKLSLPKNFRQFDYQTINDVILHISYTAEEDRELREDVEKINGMIEGNLLNSLQNISLARLFSLRQDFSTAFHRLLHNPVNTEVKIDISDKYFPIFLKPYLQKLPYHDLKVKITEAFLVLKTSEGVKADGFQLSINGTDYSGFSKESQFGDLLSKDLGTLFDAGVVREHTLVVRSAGDLTPVNPLPGDTSALEEKILGDILLYLEYRLNQS
jgi:hypothetical protein